MNPAYDDKSESGRDRLKDKVGRMEARRMKSQAEKHKSIWFGLGAFGMIGWSIVVPTLLGVGIGLWLDSARGTVYFWTAWFIGIGILCGCYNAWHWVNRQSKPH